mgnify:FL=1
MKFTIPIKKNGPREERGEPHYHEWTDCYELEDFLRGMIATYINDVKEGGCPDLIVPDSVISIGVELHIHALTERKLVCLPKASSSNTNPPASDESAGTPASNSPIDPTS